MSIETKVRLNNAVEMPMLGLGVYQMHPGNETRSAVTWALEAGYRHIDTATLYRNEADVGAVINRSDIARQELFITTKMMNDDQTKPYEALSKSLDTLQLDHVDLYLMHWPLPATRLSCWKAMEDMYRQGLCRAIGVCNFTERHLDELLSVADVIPAVNQVEFNPFLYQRSLLDKCIENDIQLEAYSPLTRGNKLDDERITSLALEYGKTPAQIMIRWCLQQNLVVIPKSKNKRRLIENADVFDFKLKQDDMNFLNDLKEDIRFCWDPTGEP